MKTYFRINDSSFLKEAKAEFKLAVRDPKRYEAHVSNLSAYLKLKGKNKFNGKRLPKFWTGRLDSKPRVIIFGLNPGQKSKVTSNDIKITSWSNYIKIRNRYFLELKSNQKNLGPYYRDFYKLFCGLFVRTYEDKIGWDFFDKNVLNLNLFPYHSNTSDDFPSHFTAGQLAMVMHHLDLILEFAISQRPKLCIFSGKPWKTLLIDQKLVKVEKEVRIVGNFSLYFFKYKELKCVLLSHFLSKPARFEGVTDTILMKKIPKKIKKEYYV